MKRILLILGFVAIFAGAGLMLPAVLYPDIQLVPIEMIHMLRGLSVVLMIIGLITVAKGFQYPDSPPKNNKGN